MKPFVKHSVSKQRKEEERQCRYNNNVMNRKELFILIWHYKLRVKSLKNFYGGKKCEKFLFGQENRKYRRKLFLRWPLLRNQKPKYYGYGCWKFWGNAPHFSPHLSKDQSNFKKFHEWVTKSVWFNFPLLPFSLVLWLWLASFLLDLIE